jgi:uncharacterized protein YoxC
MPFALQLSTNDPAFWVLVIVAASFVVIAVAMVFVAASVGRVVRTVRGTQAELKPLFARVHTMGEQVQTLGTQFAAAAGHLTTASMHVSESMALIRDEVRELKEVVGLSAETARDKIDKISRSIDETHEQLMVTTGFVTSKIINPARELAAIMAGVRRGLEVFVAPAPKQINETYSEEEMFIG